MHHKVNGTARAMTKWRTSIPVIVMIIIALFRELSLCLIILLHCIHVSTRQQAKCQNKERHYEG